MEINLNKNLDMDVLWLCVNDDDDKYEKIKIAHAKYFITRLWKYHNYLLISSFLIENNYTFTEKQKDIFVKLQKESELHDITNKYEIFLRANMVRLKYKNDETCNFKDKGCVSMLCFNQESYATEQLDKLLSSNTDICSVCYNHSKIGDNPILYCAKCKFGKIKYCGKECQKFDWKYHKYFCSTIVEINERKLAEQTATATITEQTTTLSE